MYMLCWFPFFLQLFWCIRCRDVAGRDGTTTQKKASSKLYSTCCVLYSLPNNECINRKGKTLLQYNKWNSRDEWKFLFIHFFPSPRSRLFRCILNFICTEKFSFFLRLPQIQRVIYIMEFTRISCLVYYYYF